MEDRKNLFVTDASVLLKWGVDERECFEQSMCLMSDFKEQKVEIVVPGHCYYEICNMLGRDRQDIAISFISYLMTSNIMEYDLNIELAGIAFDLMNKYPGITFYDAGYHALALQEGGTFITADEKYYKKTKRAGHVMLLKNYGKRR